VSTFEAPKLNMAGKSQFFVANIWGVIIHKISTIKDTSDMCLRSSNFTMNFIKDKGAYGLISSYHMVIISKT